MIDHDKAINYIQSHGWQDGYTPTAWYPATGESDETSTFYHEFGFKPQYKLSDVRAWLGY